MNANVEVWSSGVVVFIPFVHFVMDGPMTVTEEGIRQGLCRVELGGGEEGGGMMEWPIGGHIDCSRSLDASACKVLLADCRP